ncbi:MAG: Zn-dependent oligopeptidase [Oligoflexia bacterium]|nr:Zn-dependent oligopeptidase [Oligoflexia bacterium]
MKNIIFLSSLLFAFIAKGEPLVRHNFESGEIIKLTQQAINNHKQALDEILRIEGIKKTFENTIAEMDRIGTDLDEELSKLTFMKDVSKEKALRDDAAKAEKVAGEYYVSISTRKDIYKAYQMAYENSKKTKLTPEQRRLAEEGLKGFRRSGLDLPDEELEKVKAIQNQLVKLSTDFSSNINEAKDFVEFSAEELKGVPESIMGRFKRAGEKYIVTVNASDYMPVMQNAVNSETRRRLMVAYENRAADKNIKILKEVLEHKQKLAVLLKYKTWADYKIDDRMAKDSKTVWEFLNGLKDKLAQRNKKDMDILLAYKKKLDPKATKLEPWDPRFLENQIKETQFNLDNEVIKEYFPAEQTVQKMLDIYSKLFGIKLVKVKDAEAWSEDVSLYEIRNAKDDSMVGHFFADFVPREGKYSHAAAFTLVPGRMGANGNYVNTVSAIVANFEPPANGKPSLLTHDEVETLFHEFGHIMHQTLTRANYGSLAGTSVARDFVEAPSQMLENWVWNDKMIKEISGHFQDPKKKLPQKIVSKLLDSKGFNQGYFYTRQLLFGIFDMTLHSATKPVDDPTEVYKKLYREVAGMEPLKETNFPASFGHLMGYDAGYYGYLWSLVFADDMFTKFEKDGLLNSKVGMRYRKYILEKGNTEPADKLLEKFLGRKPSNKAFFKKLLETSCIKRLSKISA